MHRVSNLSTRLHSLRTCGLLALVLLFILSAVYAENSSPVVTNTKTKHTSDISTRPFAHVAVGVTVGTLGPGLEVVTTMTRRSNLRVDGTFLNYAHTFTQDGISYDANLRLRDYRASYDFYPFSGGFRISAGFAAYNQFNVGAVATVPAGSTVTLNSVDYYSSATDPLHGSATLAYSRKYAPTLTIGFGNAIPRSGRHWAFPTEIGAAFTGAPNFNLTMAGSACATSSAATCLPVNSYPDFESHLASEQQKITNDVAPFRVYPILSTGVTFRF
jgi:hypothetical protein